MKLRFCSCRMCKYGRKKFGNPKMITKLKRNSRHKIHIALKKNPIESLDDLPTGISVPYTD